MLSISKKSKPKLERIHDFIGEQIDFVVEINSGGYLDFGGAISSPSGKRLCIGLKSGYGFKVFSDNVIEILTKEEALREIENEDPTF